MIQEATTRRKRRRDDQMSDYYRSLAQRLRGLRNSEGQSVQTLGITSCQRGEGVTTVAVNLALAASASYDRPILVIDANFSRPSLGKLLQSAEGPGLADVLLGAHALSDAIRPSSDPQLSVLTAGTTPACLRATYDPARLSDLFQQLKADYPLVVVDLPAATPTSLCWNLAAAVDGLLLVVEAERASIAEVNQAKCELVRSGGEILGVVLNKQRQWSWAQRYSRAN